MSLRSVAKALGNSVEDVLAVTTVISDGISVAKTYMSGVKKQQLLNEEVRMVKFKDELDMDLAEFKMEYKAKMSNLADEYKLLNTPENNEKIESMLKDMGIKE